MDHATTLPAPLRCARPRPARAAVDPRPGTGGPSVAVDGSRFRVRTPKGSTQWRPDTPSHRPLAVVWGRLLVDEPRHPWCTWQEVATRVGRTNRQAASPPREDLRQGGAARRPLVRRKRQVEATGVEGVFPELLQTPLAGPTALGSRVNGRWGRGDLPVANSARAWEHISWVPVLRTRRRQLEAGHVQDQAGYLVTESLERLAPPAGPAGRWGRPGMDRGLKWVAPTALAALVTPALPPQQGAGSRGGLTFLMTRFSWQVPLAGLGRWCGVQKTTS